METVIATEKVTLRDLMLDNWFQFCYVPRLDCRPKPFDPAWDTTMSTKLAYSTYKMFFLQCVTF